MASNSYSGLKLKARLKTTALLCFLSLFLIATSMSIILRLTETRPGLKYNSTDRLREQRHMNAWLKVLITASGRTKKKKKRSAVEMLIRSVGLTAWRVLQARVAWGEADYLDDSEDGSDDDQWSEPFKFMSPWLRTGWAASCRGCLAGHQGRSTSCAFSPCKVQQQFALQLEFSGRRAGTKESAFLR